MSWFPLMESQIAESGRFFDQKRRKNFWLHWADGAETSTAQSKKVFLLLFVHKKKPSARFL
jgi:hypothetical protein